MARPPAGARRRGAVRAAAPAGPAQPLLVAGATARPCCAPRSARPLPMPLGPLELAAPVLGEDGPRPGRGRPHPPARRRAAGRADRRQRAGRGRGRPPGPGHPASRSGRPTPPAGTPTTATGTRPRSTRSFTGTGALLTGAGRVLPLHDDQAGRLPVAQPRQRLAPGAHPLLALRPGVPAAPGHPDVLPRATRCSTRTRSSTRSPTRVVRQRMVSRFDLATTVPEWALGYRFDLVLSGAARTPVEGDDGLADDD